MLLALGVRVRHLHVEVERADVLAKRHEVVTCHALHLLQLGTRVLGLALALAPPAQGDQGERHTEHQEQEERESATATATATAAGAAAGARVAHATYEIREDGIRAVLCLGVE